MAILPEKLDRQNIFINSHLFMTPYIPDYYLIGAHGVGLQSFIYYLALMGVPTTFIPLAEVDDRGKLKNFDYPVDKTEYISARGITVDRNIFGAPLSYGNNMQKVIQLVRDPIDILTSMINWYIGEIIMDSNWGSDIRSINNNLKIDFFRQHLYRTIMFKSTRNSVLATESTLYIDTNEYSGEQTIDTLKKVCSFLDVEYQCGQENELIQSYNSFPSRIWYNQNAKYFTINKGNNYIKLYIYPKTMSGYVVNCHVNSHILDTFEHIGEEYIVCTFLENYKNYKNELDIYDDNMRNSIKTILDIILEKIKFCSKLYKKYRVDWNETVSLINGNKKFKSRFLKLMDYEISDIKKHAPAKVDKWNHFTALYQN